MEVVTGMPNGDNMFSVPSAHQQNGVIFNWCIHDKNAQMVVHVSFDLPAIL